MDVNGISSDNNENLESKQDRYKWVMILLLWLLYASFGMVARSIAPLLTRIVEDLQISYTQMGLILGAWPVIYIPISLVAGGLLDKWGIRKTIFIGSLVIGLSALLRYYANGFASLLSAVALFGLGGPVISIGCPKAVSVWFKGKRRGAGVGIYTTGAWIGGLFALSTTNSVLMPLTGYNWRLVFVFYGLVALVIALLWWFFSRESKQKLVGQNISIFRALNQLIRIKGIRMIVVIGAFAFALNNGFNYWLPKILESHGFSPANAGYIACIPLLAGIPAALIVPMIVPPKSRTRVLALISLLAASTPLLVVFATGAPMFVGLIIFGFTVFLMTPLLMLILMDSPAVESVSMGIATGIFFCFAEIGGFTSQFIVGFLLDLTGSFAAGGILFTLINILILFLALFLKPSYLLPVENRIIIRND